jgi:uncharacterized membrane protein
MMNTTEPVAGQRAENPWTLTTRRIVLGAIFGAMTLALAASGLGFIPLPNVSGAMTTMHIPTILAGIIGGPVVGIFCGAIFGVTAMIAAPQFGPFVHIPSRLLVGFLAWFLFFILRRANVPVVVASAITAVGATLTNTIVTVGVAVLLKMVELSIFVVILPQAVIELIATVVIIPIIVVAVETVLHARRS